MIVTTASIAVATETYPYSAIVRSNETFTRCGPAESFYRCGRLAAGDEVEVHGRAGERWLAIRPPDGSHSWIPARHVRPTTTPGVVQVTAATAVAWIGSEIETVRQHRWQVELEVGESLQVLDEKKLAPSPQATPETWYKIAPPSGEFRYLPLDAVRAVLVDPPADVLDRLRVTVPSANGAIAPVNPSPTGAPGAETAKTDPIPRDDRVGPPPFEVGGIPLGEAPSARGFDAADVSGGTGKRYRSGPSDTSPDGSTAPGLEDAYIGPPEIGPSEAGLMSGGRPPDGPMIAAQDVGPTLDRIELDLAAAMAESRSEWDFTAIRETLTRLPLGEVSAVERGRAKLFVEKVAGLERLRDVALGRTPASDSGPLPRSSDGRESGPTTRLASREGGPVGGRFGAPGGNAPPQTLDLRIDFDQTPDGAAPAVGTGDGDGSDTSSGGWDHFLGGWRQPFGPIGNAESPGNSGGGGFGASLFGGRWAPPAAASASDPAAAERADRDRRQGAIFSASPGGSLFPNLPPPSALSQPPSPLAQAPPISPEPATSFPSGASLPQGSRPQARLASAALPTLSNPRTGESALSVPPSIVPPPVGPPQPQSAAPPSFGTPGQASATGENGGTAAPPSRPGLYDGEGLLTTVHRTTSETPPFALVDETGRFRFFVVPAPGLNLHRYKGQEVGILGRQREVAGLPAPVLMADKVIVRDRHR